jgi:osmotically inducible protein OsmC
VATERTATCVWIGELATGSGDLEFDSGAVGTLPVTWASRTQRSDGKTSPEELIAAAHASCFSMALSHGLSESGFDPEHLEVTATVTLDQVEGMPTITASDLEVSGLVPKIDAGTFIQVATEAGKNCPVSRALLPLEISVTATLIHPEPEDDDGSEDGMLDHAEGGDLDPDDVA